MAAKKATASLLTDNPNVKFKDISPEARHVVRTASSWRHSVARELAGASARYYLPAQPAGSTGFFVPSRGG
jgi:hypothetical protein